MVGRAGVGQPLVPLSFLFTCAESCHFASFSNGVYSPFFLLLLRIEVPRWKCCLYVQMYMYNQCEGAAVAMSGRQGRSFLSACIRGLDHWLRWSLLTPPAYRPFPPSPSPVHLISLSAKAFRLVHLNFIISRMETPCFASFISHT